MDLTTLTLPHLEELIYEEKVKLGHRVSGIYEDKHPDATGDGSDEFLDQLLDEFGKRFSK